MRMTLPFRIVNVWTCHQLIISSTVCSKSIQIKSKIFHFLHTKANKIKLYLTRCDCLIILLFLDFEKIYASLGIVVNDHSHEEEDDHAHQKRVKTQESV